MDNYILVGGQEEPVAPVSAVETPRRFRKAGCIGILFVGCGALWQAAQRASPKVADMAPYKKITGVYTEADLVKIFGRDGPKPEHLIRRRPEMMTATHGQVDIDTDDNSHDIYQGQLGDCYFDASLAAVAHKHKDWISGMFTHIDADQGYFETRWFIGGHWITVAVNEQIPVDPSSHVPFFLWTSSELTMWPAILEKSFAKIAGNYKAIEAGFPGEALQYVTGAPIKMIQDNDFSGAWTNVAGATGLEDLYNQIKEAVDNDWPIGIGTYHGGYHGIHGGHAYTLYGYSDNYQGHGRSVRVRNPWGVNSYSGDITGQTQTIGDFWCTWEEFHRNYIMVNIAKMRHGYPGTGVSDDWSAPVTSQGASKSLTFSMPSNNPFTVMALWFPERVTRAAHCPANNGNGRMTLTKQGGSAQSFAWTANGMSVDGQGSGTYTLDLAISGSFTGLPQIAIGVYWDGQSSALSLVESPEPSSTLNVSTLVPRPVSLLDTPRKPASLQPIETPSCTNYYDRVINHMDGSVVPSDAYFPESESSIADYGTDCGDAAHGYRESCSKFNHWQSMVEVGDRMNDDMSCFSFQPASGGTCQISNDKCNHNAVFFCHIVGCTMQGSLQPGYYYPHTDGPCCGCNDPSNYR